MLRCTSSVGLKLEWVVYAENKIDRGKEREEGEEEREKEKKVRFFFFNLHFFFFFEAESHSSTIKKTLFQIK